MRPDPIHDFVFTDHALAEMARRGLTAAIVRCVLERPAQRWEARPGRAVLQDEVAIGDPPRSFLVRVFVDVDRTPCEVVKAYRTCRIARYWRRDP